MPEVAEDTNRRTEVLLQLLQEYTAKLRDRSRQFVALAHQRYRRKVLVSGLFAFLGSAILGFTLWSFFSVLPADQNTKTGEKEMSGSNTSIHQAVESDAASPKINE